LADFFIKKFNYTKIFRLRWIFFGERAKNGGVFRGGNFLPASQADFSLPAAVGGGQLLKKGFVSWIYGLN